MVSEQLFYEWIQTVHVLLLQNSPDEIFIGGYCLASATPVPTPLIYSRYSVSKVNLLTWYSVMQSLAKLVL